MTERGYMPQAKTVEWETPQELFDKLDAEFSFTLDPAATDENAKCEKHYTIETDGLEQNWAGERVFLNPPYGRELNKWVKKCYDEIYSLGPPQIIVALLPARTDTKWFHNWVYHYTEIRFLKGRVKYENGSDIPNSAPFPSMIVIWKVAK